METEALRALIVELVSLAEGFIPLCDDNSKLERVCREVRALLDAAESSLPGTGWRTDMENAPKDGTRFLAWPCVLHGEHVVAAETYWYHHPSVEGWLTDLIDCNDYEFAPTHWMPLPAAPTPRKEGDS